jgi:hypothetical protein
LVGHHPLHGAPPHVSLERQFAGFSEEAGELDSIDADGHVAVPQGPGLGR